MSTQNDLELKAIIEYYKLDNFITETYSKLVDKIKSTYGDNASKTQASLLYDTEDIINALISYWNTSYREASIVDKYLKDKILFNYSEE